MVAMEPIVLSSDLPSGPHRYTSVWIRVPLTMHAGMTRAGQSPAPGSASSPEVVQREVQRASRVWAALTVCKSPPSRDRAHLVAWIGGVDALSPTRVPGHAVRT